MGYIILTYYLVIITTLTFILWGVDKYRALKHQWRIPERWLVGLTLLGGCFGALTGMLLFKHKTRKPKFWILAIISCLLYLALILFLVKSR